MKRKVDNRIKILIPDGEKPRIRRVVFCLSQNPNYQIYILSAYRKSHMRFSRYCQHFYSVDSPDFSNERLAKINEIIDDKGIDIVFLISIEGYRLILNNFNALSKLSCMVLAPSSDIYEKAVRKDLFGEFCESNKVNIPKTISIDSIDFLDEIENFSFPALLKPSEGEGGIGILLFSEIESCKDYVTKNFESLKGQYILQEYVAAHEIDVNVLCYNGRTLVHTIQEGIIPPESEFRFTEGIQLIENKQILDFVKDLMAN